jgi:hypothetical protein
MADEISLVNAEGTKHLLAFKLRVDGKPVLQLQITRRDGRSVSSIELGAVRAGLLADWIIDLTFGWNFEQVIHPAPVVGELPAPESPLVLTVQRAKLVCWVLNVLVWQLPPEYGSPWLLGTMAAAGIKVDWDNKQERFRPKEVTP